MEYQEFLFAAFAVVWIVLFAYVMVLLRRQAVIKRKIESLEAQYQRKQKGGRD
jgi:CcmD family protein